MNRPLPKQARMRPAFTGSCIALGLVAFAAMRNAPTVYIQLFRWLAAGIGIAAFSTHILQRIDESLDSRRWARRRKLQILSQAVSRQPLTQQPFVPDRSEQADATFEAALDSPIHFNESPFAEPDDHDVRPLFPDSSVNPGKADSAHGNDPAVIDPVVAFEEAMLDGNWLAASDAYKSSMAAGELIAVDESELTKLRKSSLEFIFHRMHSGTVREDVASLARNITQIFPLSLEGKTLAPVLGVLRRSAGLCPRCEKPYKGVANACHDCLRGTPEAYQIAWDDQPV